VVLARGAKLLKRLNLKPGGPDAGELEVSVGDWWEVAEDHGAESRFAERDRESGDG
jgi:hypothetical protein